MGLAGEVAGKEFVTERGCRAAPAAMPYADSVRMEQVIAHAVFELKCLSLKHYEPGDNGRNFNVNDGLSQQFHYCANADSAWDEGCRTFTSSCGTNSFVGDYNDCSIR